MPQRNAAIDYRGYGVIASPWAFDLQFYRDIGLRFDPLEDPNPEAAMPSLRRAAAATIKKSGSPQDLETAHDRVLELIHDVDADLSWDAVDAEHDAVIAWQERNSHSDKPDQRAMSKLLRVARIAAVGLVRPRMKADAEGEAPYLPVTKRGANFYSSPREVAGQLVLARAGLLCDL